jgi:hypothetical protein
MSTLKKNIKFKVCSKHKPCSFCNIADIPAVMEMKTGKAICAKCIENVLTMMEGMPDDVTDTLAQPNKPIGWD